MTCREFAEFLHAYLSRELPAGQVAEFDRHLALCRACVNYLQSYERTVELGRQAYPDETLPADVPAGLVQAILAARRRG